jgi:predicted secreted protein
VPRLWAKLLWTTVVTTIVFALLYLGYVYRVVALDDLAALLGMPR